MEQVTEVESIEEETSISEIGPLEHLEEMHHEILKVTNAFIKGRSKEKIIYLRRRFPHYFQSIKLYNAIVGLFKINDVSVADRQFIHEIFDWRVTDESVGKKP